jgi:uncharacterized protein
MTDTTMPLRAADRIALLDVLRGIAICGILLMNIPGMGMTGDRDRPATSPGWDADWIAWGVQGLLFEGTMRGLFTLLFGAGMLLMLRSAEQVPPRVAAIDIWARRCLALMALGLVNCLVLAFPGEILWCYGITGLGLLAFRAASVRTLLIAAALCLSAMTAWDVADGYRKGAGLQAGMSAEVARAAGLSLDPAQRAAIAKVAAARLENHPSAAATARERARRLWWPTLVGWSWESWSEGNIGAPMWQGVVESLCFMLAGMGLFRLGILTGQARPRVYAGMAMIGYSGGIGVRLFNLMLSARAGFDPVAGAGSLPLYVIRYADYEIGRLLMTIGHVGLVALLFRAGWLGRATVVRAMGRMALTVYMLQSLITSILFYGLGLLDRIGFAGLMLSAAAIWVATAWFCRLWMRDHAMGPAETVLRIVAYGGTGWRRGFGTAGSSTG